ncbi:hypothetical protein [Streptomyces sp. NPDC058254]|uniref:hypothetical protein n=1 Tax=Streptomyces sp. NPDC058254 TaxID=3346406 RepID=UPI0036E82F77
MSARLSPQREADIAARAQAATPAPWERAENHGKHFYAYLGGSYMRGVGTLNFGEGDDAEADRAFVLNAREDVDLLLAELAAVRAERDEARAELAKRSIRAIHALKSPVPAGSQHYRSGWDDGLEAAIDAVREMAEGATS